MAVAEIRTQRLGPSAEGESASDLGQILVDILAPSESHYRVKAEQLCRELMEGPLSGWSFVKILEDVSKHTVILFIQNSDGEPKVLKFLPMEIFLARSKSYSYYTSGERLAGEAWALHFDHENVIETDKIFVDS